MKIKDFKKWAAGIPESLDEVDLSICQPDCGGYDVEFIDLKEPVLIEQDENEVLLMDKSAIDHTDNIYY